MNVSEEERQEIIRRHYSEKMARLGRSRSSKKRKAAQRNVKIAQAARWGKPLPKRGKK